MQFPLVSTSIDHLGLVSAIFNELGLVELIDSLIEQDIENRKISVGTSCKVPLARRSVPIAKQKN
ncbi:DUF4277 domain-containing protein [Bernardetia sp. MNP-M8]|uniref:DUF4277 domain-containing protein n=1 Tax=Bernardetia sp. MNP-M8 TaxID=3127470 RepID=UPI0030D4FC40